MSDNERVKELLPVVSRFFGMFLMQAIYVYIHLANECVYE